MRSFAWNCIASMLILLTALPGDGLAASATDSFCDVRYETLELGAPDAQPYAQDLSNRGHVTGNSSYGGAFLWSCERDLESIGHLFPRRDNIGSALNDRDQIVVIVGPQYPQLLPDSYLWERGKPPRLIALNREFTPESISIFGVAAFFSQTWSKARGVQDMDIGVNVLQADISRLGRLGGTYFDENTSETRLFTWTRREGVRTLGAPLSDDAYEYVADVNDRGELLVNGNRAPYIVHRDGSVTTLPLRPGVRYLSAYHFNLQREVIGTEIFSEEQPNGGFGGAFVWDPKHGYRSLEELFDSQPGDIFEPEAINDWGWILGNRVHSNASLLIPVPANNPRYENFNRLKGANLCRALAEVKVHRLLCSLRQ
jgi:hypothetical protein